MLTYLLTDPTVARVFYASVVGLVGLLAWRAKHHPTLMLWCWLFANWVFFNICFAVIGPQREAAFTALSDAFVCVMCAHIAIKYRSNAAWSVVSLFVVSCAVAFAAWFDHWQGGFLFYLCLNVLFLSRMAVVGADASLRIMDRVRHHREPHRHARLHLG